MNTRDLSNEVPTPEQVEDRLRAALLSRADALVPDGATPPLMAWQDLPGRPGSRWARSRGGARSAWFVPLAAAASVALVAGGIVGVRSATVLSSSTPSGPAAGGTPTVAVATAAPSSVLSTGTPSRFATAQPSAGTPSSAGLVSARDLGDGLKLSVPVAWSVSDGPADYVGGKAWCIESAPGACEIIFTRIKPGIPVNVEIEGGYDSNPQYCDPATATATTRTVREAREDRLGARVAEFRWWTWSCEKRVEIVQYVVPDPEGFILWTESGSQGTRDAMTAIARSSTLPVSTGGLRLYDQGTVQAVTPVGDGFDIQLRRARGTDVDRWASTDAVTTYHLPTALLPVGYRATNLERNVLVVHTDGRAVTSVVFPGG